MKPTISGKFQTKYGSKDVKEIGSSILLIIQTEKARQDLVTEVSDCCRSEMTPPMSIERMNALNIPQDMRVYKSSTYTCRRCGKPCNPKN
jgi:hypothetical protein